MDVEFAEGPEIIILAKDFSEFIGLLKAAKPLKSNRSQERKNVESGTFSPLLRELCLKSSDLRNAEAMVRAIALKIVIRKGHFALHADKLSHFIYDLQFYLYTNVFTKVTKELYLKTYPEILVSGAPFSTGGYSPSFVEQWFDRQVKKGNIVVEDSYCEFTEKYIEELRGRLEKLLEKPLKVGSTKKAKKIVKKRPRKKKL